MCVIVIVGFITCGKYHPIIGLGNPHVVAFVLLIVGHDVECICPCSRVQVDALRKVILVGFQKSSKRGMV